MTKFHGLAGILCAAERLLVRRMYGCTLVYCVTMEAKILAGVTRAACNCTLHLAKNLFRTLTWNLSDAGKNC